MAPKYKFDYEKNLGSYFWPSADLVLHENLFNNILSNTISISIDNSIMKYLCFIFQLMPGYHNIENHSYSIEHIINSKHPNAGHVKSKLTAIGNISLVHTVCNICKLPVSGDMKDHFTSDPMHLTKKDILDRYLSFCQENEINPLDPSSDKITDFVHQLTSRK